jgi:hypothetical protein
LRLSKKFISIVVGVGLASCALGPVKDEEPVARAFDNYLYRSDLDKVIPVTASPEDSAVIAEAYINKWVHENVLIGQAEINLTSDQLDFEEKLTQYKNSLIIYAYEQALVDEKLDTVIALLSTINYYESHKENFILLEPAFRLRYVKLINEAPELDQVKKWMVSDDEFELEELREYSTNNAVKYFFNDSIWVTPKDIIEELPDNANMIVDEPQKGLRIINDENFTYMVYVKEYLNTGDQAPVDLVKDDIRSLILNKRKLELLKKMRKDIYTDAIRKKNVEYFYK